MEDIDTPMCTTCLKRMVCVGGIGKDVGWSTEETSGVTEQELYQCPECKTVVIQ